MLLEFSLKGSPRILVGMKLSESEIMHRFGRGIDTLLSLRFLLTVSMSLLFFPASAPEAQAVQSDVARRIHDLAIFFTSNGWFSCSERADQIATFLGGDAQGQVFVVNQPTSSTGLITVTLLVPREAGASVGDMVFAPGARGCPATYTISGVSEMTCPERIEASERTDFVELGESGHFVAQVSEGTVVRLSPVPNGCARVQTEIVTGTE